MPYTHATLQPLPFLDQRWNDGFWFKKETITATKTLLSTYETMNNDENSVSFKNFHTIADKTGEPYKGSTYWGDGDCYKWIEAALYIYSKNNDAKLKALIDYEIDAIIRCQQENGYIHCYIQMTKEAQPFTIKMYHEDYNFGHLFTLAAEHHKITGQTNLLNTAIKAADLLEQVLSKGDVTTATF